MGVNRQETGGGEQETELMKVKSAALNSIRAILAARPDNRLFSDGLEVVVWREGQTLGEIASKLGRPLTEAEVALQPYEEAGFIARAGEGASATYNLATND